MRRQGVLKGLSKNYNCSPNRGVVRGVFPSDLKTRFSRACTAKTAPIKGWRGERRASESPYSQAKSLEERFRLKRVDKTDTLKGTVKSLLQPLFSLVDPQCRCRISFYLPWQVGTLPHVLYVPWPINGGRICRARSRIPLVKMLVK